MNETLKNNLQKTITSAYEGTLALTSSEAEQAVHATIEGLTQGELRVAEKIDNQWQTNAWVKQAILLYFKIQKMEPVSAGNLMFFDKIKTQDFSKSTLGIRIVPPAIVRVGAHIARSCVLMPSFVNIGAYVGEGTMVDTWATVGSCAQIGQGVHLSGGVGIGGVLEPLQASPVIIEDHVFVGSRCVVVEGVYVEEGAVLGAGVVLTSSTKIIDVTQKSPIEIKGRIPKNSVVIPGTTQKEFPGGTYGVPCALIIGKRNENTNKKTSLNDTLREYSVAV